MIGSSLGAAAMSFAFAIAPAAAQSTGQRAPPLYPDLPNAAEVPVHGVIPDVGPTPGIVLEATSPSEKCSRDAVKAADGLMAPTDAVSTCNDAIASPVTAERQLAGTHVNRGVLLLTMKQVDDARRDFERALELDPDLPEALVNRGGMKIAEGRAAEGVADLDRAIALGPERPERAYYYRGLGREDLKDMRGAYEDYRMAQMLKPDWDEPARELSRFQVTRTPP